MQNLFEILVVLSNMDPQKINKNCEELLATKIVLSKKERSKGMNELEKAMWNLVGCGIDDLDYKLLSNSLILQLYLEPNGEIDSNDERTIITHAQLLKALEKIMEKEGFKKTKKHHLLSHDFYNRPADINNWENDKEVLKENGKQDFEIKIILEVLKEKSNPSITYKEFHKKNGDRIRWLTNIERVIFNNDKIDNTSVKYYRLSRTSQYYTVYKESEAQSNPILFYFTEFENEQARKMELLILEEKQIKELIAQQFIFFPLFNDDKTRLHGPVRGMPEFKGMRIRTLAERNEVLQNSIFMAPPTPSFVIVNSRKEVLGKIGNHLDREIFLEFLINGLENRNC